MKTCKRQKQNIMKKFHIRFILGGLLSLGGAQRLFGAKEMMQRDILWEVFIQWAFIPILSPSSNMGDVHYCIKQQSNQPTPLEYRSAKKETQNTWDIEKTFKLVTSFWIILSICWLILTPPLLYLFLNPRFFWMGSL